MPEGTLGEGRLFWPCLHGRAASLEISVKMERYTPHTLPQGDGDCGPLELHRKICACKHGASELLGV